MRSTLLYAFCLLAAVTFLTPAHAQSTWGVVPNAHWAITDCSWDPGAPAIVLHDECLVKLKDRYVLMNYRKRVKILTEEGKEKATQALRYIKNADAKHPPIFNIEAHTLKHLPDGTTSTIPLTEDEFIWEAEDDELGQLILNFKQVEVGDIVEVQYTHKVGAWKSALPSFSFWTANAPSLFSEIIIDQATLQRFSAVTQGPRLQARYQNAPVQNNTWRLDSLPSLKQEVFAANPYNHIDQLFFQNKETSTEPPFGWWPLVLHLSNQGSESPYNLFLGTGTGKDLKEEVKALKKQRASLTEKELVIALRNLVADNYEWNGRYSLFPSSVYSAASSKKGNNSADINLTLYLLLRHRNKLNAHLLLISTKDHGRVNQNYPTFRAFNHVAIVVHTKQGPFIVDATRKHLPMEYLPVELYNGPALYMPFLSYEQTKTPQYTVWQEVAADKKHLKGKRVVESTIRFGESTDEAQVQMEITREGYLAYYGRMTWEDTASLAKDITGKYQLAEEPLTLDSVGAHTLDSVRQNILKASLSLNTTLTNAPGLIFCQPLATKAFKNNPFNTAQRTFPVDLMVRESSTFITHWEIPEGYAVETLPEAVHIKAPEIGATMVSQVTQMEGKLTFIVQVKLDQPTIAVAQYPALSRFGAIVEEHLNRVVVLRKAN